MEKWKLVWADEFEGNMPDTKNWSYELGYVRNNELQEYTDSPENVSVENSCLVIQANKTGDPSRPYTSGSVHTFEKKSFLYGRLEMRAKLPYGKGIWPAFWTLGINIGEKSWPACGEIDVMELVGGPNANGGFDGDRTIYGAIHYPAEQRVWNQNAGTLMNERYCDAFHTIGLEWNEDRMFWYVDGICYHQENIQGLEEFHKPHYVILNLAIGGEWPGDPDDSTRFPQKYEIDWIRYYQKEQD